MEVSHKLKNAFEGALAGGGDPASSPLYVFGPFLSLIVGAGVAGVTFGASVWMAILTVVAVSGMYRLVMRWVIDGSGGSGLCEDEFGPWAIKVNASITLIEYTLTFLVSVAALVTFLSDRFVHLSALHYIFTLRTDVALVVSLLIGLGVTFGPRLSARIFGPATLGVLLLLWLMIIITIFRTGLHFPSLHLSAFSLKNIDYTLGGYSRILALMTGIEVFANLVPAYSGSAAERSRKAFGSLVIIMGTTSLTMLIVGPAILHYANPIDANVSVFTQTMDAILPKPISYLGTVLGVMVLFSAAAASIHGIQNLALGLRYRHYIPSWLGSVNRFEVADKAVWLIVIVAMILLIIFGTHENTYLALYAAGVFILLTLTSWAAAKRLYINFKHEKKLNILLGLCGILFAAMLTTMATCIVFLERFFLGAWVYLLITPIFYIIFSYVRKRLGQPISVSKRIKNPFLTGTLPMIDNQYFYHESIRFKNILVPLDQSPTAEFAVSCAQTIARNYAGSIHFLTVLSADSESDAHLGKYLPASNFDSANEYLRDVTADLKEAGYQVTYSVKTGKPAEVIGNASVNNIDLLVMTTHGHSFLRRWVTSTTTTDVVHQTTPPLIAIRPTDSWRSIRTGFKRLLVTLDASEVAEQIIPYVKEIALKFSSRVTFLSVPEASDSDVFISDLKKYLDKIAANFANHGVSAEAIVTGTDPYQTIIKVSEDISADLIMLVSHGRGGTERQSHVKIGSVTEKLLHESPCPLFLVSAE